MTIHIRLIGDRAECESLIELLRNVGVIARPVVRPISKGQRITDGTPVRIYSTLTARRGGAR